MKEGDVFGQWQMSEFSHYLEKNRGDPLLDSKTVFLGNPKQKVELDRIIREQLWPAVLDELAPTPIRVVNMYEGWFTLIGYR